MKILFRFFLIMASATSTQAGYNACPKGWVRANSFTQNLLLKMQGYHQVGDCKLELRVCNPDLPEVEDAQVADALITVDGAEYYIPLYVAQGSDSTSSNLTSGQREVIFKFLDENRDPLAGDYEKDRFSMRLNFEKTKMVEISLLRKNDYLFNKFIFWKLPKRLSCLSK